MRIGRIHLAGLAALAAGAAAGEAEAGDVSVSTATTTPLATSAPDGVSAGNVTVTSSGSITVTSGAAVTIDSSNTVSNAGSLLSSDANDTTGVLIGGGFTGSLTNTGLIGLTETYTATDGDSDGDFDGTFAVGSGRRGVWLQSGAAFIGDIDNQSGGSINIEGASSAAIQLDAFLDGDLTSAGAVSVIGDNGYGVAVNQGVSGDVDIAGSLNVRGANSVGVEINGDVGGALGLGGTITASGFRSTVRPSSQTVLDALDADDLLIGGPAVAVHADVGGGVTIRGIGVEDDEDDDGDAVTEADGDSNDDVTASIASFGSAPALWIAPDADAPADIALGATATGHGLRNRGSIAASGVYDDVDAIAVSITGLGLADVTTAGGVLNDGGISASAVEGLSTSVYFGSGASAPEFVNRGGVHSRTTSETAQGAYGIYIDAGANVAAVNNSGVFNVAALGEVSDAVAILDRSGTLSSVINSGTIAAQVVATDEDTTDDEIPEATGQAIAIDLSANSVAATVRQVADTVFTDDDATDNDVNGRPTIAIIGDIRFGSGADRLDLLAGQMAGDVDFGAGADTLIIDNGATFVGRIDNTGALDIDVLNGQLGHAGGETLLTSAHFGADSELAVLVSNDADESSLLTASGAVTFDLGAVITPVIPAGLPESGAQVFLTAATLTGAQNVTRVITGAGAPYIYNLAITSATTNTPNDSLAASYVLKSPAELGLDANQTAAYAPIVTAMRTDDEASAALADLETADDFFSAYEQLLPDYSSAAAELAATAIQQAQAASSNRLAATRLGDVDRTSAWVQEIAYGLSRDPKAFGVEYRGSGFGFAMGVDGPLNNGALFGLSAAFVASEAEEPGRRDGEVAASFGQANAYLGAGMGPINLDFVAGLGAGRMKSQRFVDIGDDFSRTAAAEWWAYEGHVAARASTPWSIGRSFVVTPSLGLTYVSIAEEGYTEEGGGTAVDLDIDEATSQRLWGDVGLDFAWRFGREGDSFEPHLSFGHRLNVIKDPAERTVEFVSGGTPFTLTDEKPGDGGPLVGFGFNSTNGWSTVSLHYEGEFGEQIERHSLNAALRFRF